MTEQDREVAIQTVKDILHVLHEKRYEDLPSCVDDMELDVDTEVIRECVQGTLDMNGFDAFDEFGVPCNFHPSYEYHHEVEFYECSHDGFDAEYDLTSGGEMVDLRLQLSFLYLKDGLKRIFRTIDPM
ncbi:MAG: hypothetical protein K2M91_00055 [Lachnospiraceae bacterium]|nr:hypothetical protein [Lachnospiraceae bacterium]